MLGNEILGFTNLSTQVTQFLQLCLLSQASTATGHPPSLPLSHLVSLWQPYKCHVLSGSTPRCLGICDPPQAGVGTLCEGEAG